MGSPPALFRRVKAVGGGGVVGVGGLCWRSFCTCNAAHCVRVRACVCIDDASFFSLCLISIIVNSCVFVDIQPWTDVLRQFCTNTQQPEGGSSRARLEIVYFFDTSWSKLDIYINIFCFLFCLLLFLLLFYFLLYFILIFWFILISIQDTNL